MILFILFYLLFFSLPSRPTFAFDLEGEVKVETPVPKTPWIQIQPEHQLDCGKEKPSAALEVSKEGWVANAVVYLEGDFQSPSPTPDANYLLDQAGCEFVPHVMIIPPWATLSILNSDGFLHNVRGFEGTTMLFNDAMPERGQVLKKKFKMPGMFLIRCGIHPWMHAIVIVQRHPYYALTNQTGYFKLKDIPNEIYRLVVWHETLGEMKVDVTPETGHLNLTFPRKEPITPSDKASNK